MSEHAIWIALSVDTFDSEMFDGATAGERLAWVCLLCYVKSVGRAGKVRFRKNAFCRNYSLSERSVDGMLSRCKSAGAVEMADGVITICRWSTYQRRGAAAESRERARMLQTGTTQHSCLQNSTGQNTPQSPPRTRGGGLRGGQRNRGTDDPAEADRRRQLAALARAEACTCGEGDRVPIHHAADCPARQYHPNQEATP